MNIKNLFQKPKPKKLNNATRRAAVPIAEDYDSEEPNVRLSKAFFVVMLLHLVAVGGIFAFSSLKKNAPAAFEEASQEVGVDPSLEPGSTLYSVKKEDTLGSIASTHGVTRSDLEKVNRLAGGASIETGDKLIIPAQSSSQPVSHDVQNLLQLSANTSTAPSTQKVVNTLPVKPALPLHASVVSQEKPAAKGSQIYTVEKGDNPAAIAKKHGIKYVSLIEANQITDPRKLQIGQKLIIPAQ